MEHLATLESSFIAECLDQIFYLNQHEEFLKNDLWESHIN
jgi:hypothetical protein